MPPGLLRLLLTAVAGGDGDDDSELFVVSLSRIDDVSPVDVLLSRSDRLRRSVGGTRVENEAETVAADDGVLALDVDDDMWGGMAELSTICMLVACGAKGF